MRNPYLVLWLGLLLFSPLVRGASDLQKSSATLKESWSAPLDWGGSPLLEDVSPSGLMLLNEMGGLLGSGKWSISDPHLALWVAGQTRPSHLIPLLGWPEYQKQLQGYFRLSLPGPFKFINHGRRIVGIQGPWIVLIDVATRKEVRRLKLRDDLGELSPEFEGALSPPPQSSVLAVSFNGSAIAVGVNARKAHRIDLFSSDLQLVRSWIVPKYIQDLCWSHHGNKIGVLYFNAPRNRGLNWFPDRTLAGVRDVSVFDSASAKEPLSFATGHYEAKIAFNSEDALLCVVDHRSPIVYHSWQWKRDKLRMFSSQTGRLVRTIEVKPTGVRNNFCFSPDGRFIAAETTVDTPTSFFHENVSLYEYAGFAVIDAATGKVIYRIQKHMLSSPGNLLPFFFSAGGKTLIVNFNIFGEGDTNGHLVGYELDSQTSNK